MRSLADIKVLVEQESIDVENCIVLLHQEGISIVESMKFLVNNYGICLADAKKIVTSHNVWRPVVVASEAMQDEFLESMPQSDLQSKSKN